MIMMPLRGRLTLLLLYAVFNVKSLYILLILSFFLVHVKITIHHSLAKQNSLSRPPRQKFFEFSLQRSGIAMKNMDFSVLIAVGMRKGARESDNHSAERRKEFDDVKFVNC
jgi:hypothetical protein